MADRGLLIVFSGPSGVGKEMCIRDRAQGLGIQVTASEGAKSKDKLQ